LFCFGKTVSGIFFPSSRRYFSTSILVPTRPSGNFYKNKGIAHFRPRMERFFIW
jgi:hypothetical protein